MHGGTLPADAKAAALLVKNLAQAGKSPQPAQTKKNKKSSLLKAAFFSAKWPHKTKSLKIPFDMGFYLIRHRADIPPASGFLMLLLGFLH